MIDRATLNVRDAKRAKGFYDPVLSILGYDCLKEKLGTDGHISMLCYGYDRPAFLIRLAPPDSLPDIASNNVCISFQAKAAYQVDSFHTEALKCGGLNCQEPGAHTEEGDYFYNTIVYDLDGNMVEAVCRNRWNTGKKAETREAGEDKKEISDTESGLLRFTLGVALLMEWLIALAFYYFFVLAPQWTHSEYVIFKQGDNPFKSYAFEAMPFAFLAAMLFYYSRKNFTSAQIAAFAPIIIPLTSWGFLGMTNILAGLVMFVGLEMWK